MEHLWDVEEQAHSTESPTLQPSALIGSAARHHRNPKEIPEPDISALVWLQKERVVVLMLRLYIISSRVMWIRAILMQWEHTCAQ